ncbi:3-oxoacyl-ACP synthase [Aquimarina intermedia]|uniref:GreA/GreB family transcription elongation factor n=1 Tax=Aquimarina intermedia TaxID=350814 RepID=A0A5S5CCD6_9FLAO|nr:3-oxoacyl-ACP synthase [Aquimarina intermedia]TYP77031.1 hypothetical protein BD809_101178 [Aquimarina intermedia]
MEATNIKEELLLHCQNYVNSRRKRLTFQITDIQMALESETKSSAGDKHETGRAMLHIEREKLGVQLAEVQKLDLILLKISLTPASLIKLGSLVYTDKGLYFLSISVGKVDTKGISCFAIAANSPIGKLLIGKKNNDTIQFNGNTIVIENIL